MGWYRAGTVSVTNGSAVVTGANTDFVSNTQQGEAFLGPDGRVYEVGQVISATQLALGGNYQGASAGGQGYALMPTSSFARDLALGAAQLLNTFAGVRDGIGAGLFPDGTIAAPAFRFGADQDTGIYRPAPNTIAVVAGGISRAILNGDGLTVTGAVAISNGSSASLNFSTTLGNWSCGIPDGSNRWRLIENQFGSEKLSVDLAGHLLVGKNAGSAHHFAKLTGQGGEIFGISNGDYGFVTARFYSVGATNLGSIVECAIGAGTNPSTGRSINAGGTINASGADYAEYMTKAAGCGTIAPGDVCGVDGDGKLTRTWAEAISFVVKSTDPSLVGGDVWAAHIAPKPEAAGPAPIAPGEAPVMPDDDAPEALATWRLAAVAHAALVTAYPAAHAAWAADQAAYETALADWEDELETARQCVDRIAFCGQVPVNVTGDFAVGDYIIAVAHGNGIKAIAIGEADITFDQYRRRIGKVWAVRDGRAWIDVQHG